MMFYIYADYAEISPLLGFPVLKEAVIFLAVV